MPVFIYRSNPAFESTKTSLLNAEWTWKCGWVCPQSAPQKALNVCLNKLRLQGICLTCSQKKKKSKWNINSWQVQTAQRRRLSLSAQDRNFVDCFSNTRLLEIFTRGWWGKKVKGIALHVATSGGIKGLTLSCVPFVWRQQHPHGIASEHSSFCPDLHRMKGIFEDWVQRYASGLHQALVSLFSSNLQGLVDCFNSVIG